jgi:glucan phosphorylase
MPEDMKQAYVYGLDAESIRQEFLTYLTAHMEKFSTDRTIKEYADDIWGLKPVGIEPP